MTAGDDLDVDVAVVGGGPAGAALATVLAPVHRVALVDRPSRGRAGLGETLPGAASRLLRELGVWDAFLAQGHLACHARLSRWGGPELLAQDALRDLDGASWSLDRAAFDRLLRAAATGAGARVLTGRGRVVGQDERGWCLAVGQDAGPQVARVRARVLVDAGGRGSSLLRFVAGQRRVVDRLVCVWTHLPLRHRAQGTTYVESAVDGWWFTAPGPDGRRVLAFHTDSDIIDIGEVVHTLTERAAAVDGLAEQLRDSHLDKATSARACSAGSTRLEAMAGADWLAVGDAAMALDPLSSQGLFHALYTGVTAGPMVSRALAGERGALAQLERSVEPVWSAYAVASRHAYASERRWPNSPFWLARHRRLEQAS